MKNLLFLASVIFMLMLPTVADAQRRNANRRATTTRRTTRSTNSSAALSPTQQKDIACIKKFYSILQSSREVNDYIPDYCSESFCDDLRDAYEYETDDENVYGYWHYFSLFDGDGNAVSPRVSNFKHLGNRWYKATLTGDAYCRPRTAVRYFDMVTEDGDVKINNVLEERPDPEDLIESEDD